MFREVATTGGLEMQLVYYRGMSECRASRWISNPEQLSKTMSQIACNTGHTQIGKILNHTQKETKLLRVNALVFVGDAIEENPDTLADEAGELGRLGVPAFMFQRGQAARSSGPIARSLNSHMAFMAGLIPEPRASWLSSCGQWRYMLWAE
jgi:hypothetical protein